MPTKIEWCDETFNPWWGCERVSPACAHCYADTFARRIGMPELWAEKDHRSRHGFRFFGDKHWAEPLKWARTLPEKLGRRPRVFCASMADVFEDRPELTHPRERLFNLVEATPDLDWLMLTKRPELVVGMLDDLDRVLPANVWVGVSIENARYTWRADVLREIPAAVRFISAEPLLGSLYTTTPAPRPGRDHVAGAVPGVSEGRAATRDRASLDLTNIDWIIVGGESGPGARPFHLQHAREIIRVASTMVERPAIFVKQLGAKPINGCSAHSSDPRAGSWEWTLPLHLRDRKGGDMDEWPADLRVREFPRLAVAA